MIVQSQYGLAYAGVGWGLWRDKSYIPDDVIFTVNCQWRPLPGACLTPLTDLSLQQTSARPRPRTRSTSASPVCRLVATFSPPAKLGPCTETLHVGQQVVGQ